MPFLDEINQRPPLTYAFADDGATPDNPRLPLVVYQGVISSGARDPATTFEELDA
jgi:uncharacterized protein YjlB